MYSTFFPLFITKYVDTKVYSLVYGTAFLLSFFVALYLGKIADRYGIRKAFFVSFSLTTTLLGMSLTPLAETPLLALCLYSLMTISHQQALVFYNSMLLSFEKKGMASGFGVAMGYVGSAVALIFLARYMRIPYVFLQSSMIFFLLSLPSLLLLENPPIKEKILLREIFKDKRFIYTVLSILSLTEVANTLIAMMGIYLKKVYGLVDTEIYRIIGLSAVGGVLGGLFFGRLIDRVGVYALFPFGFLLWSMFLSFLYIVPRDLILLIGLFGGFSLAHLWTTSRVLILEAFPKAQASVRLSFLSLTERIASTTGLFAWSFFLTLTGDNYKLSALLMLIFPLLGAFLFIKR